MNHATYNTYLKLNRLYRLGVVEVDDVDIESLIILEFDIVKYLLGIPPNYDFFLTENLV